jgi:integrase
MQTPPKSSKTVPKFTTKKKGIPNMPTTRALERDEIHRLFQCISGRYATRNRNMLICGIAMALRATELCRLNVGDVLDDNGDVKRYVAIRGETAKFGKGRIIRIGQAVRGALADFINHKQKVNESLSNDAPLFCSQKGGYLDRTRLFRIVKAVLKKAGVDESVHTLRKTGGTHYYITSKYDLIATQQFLGHSDPSVTRKYINMTPEQLERYSEVFSTFLIDAIEVKDNSIHNLLHFSDSDLLLELQQRGYDITAWLLQKRQMEIGEANIISIDAVRRKASV